MIGRPGMGAPPPGSSAGGGGLPSGWDPRRIPRDTSQVLSPGGPDDSGNPQPGGSPPVNNGLQVPQPGQVGGPWGGTLYPEWFQRGIGPNMSPEHAANLFADFVSQNPTMDFGFYWNQFRPGSMMGDRGIRFGTGTPGNPAGQAPAPQPQPEPTPGATVGGNSPVDAGAGGNVVGEQTGVLHGRWDGMAAQGNRTMQANRNSVQRPQSPQAQQATAKQPPVQVIVNGGGGGQAQSPPPPQIPTQRTARPTRLGAQAQRPMGQAPQTSLQRPPNTGLGVSPGNPTPQQRQRPGGIGSNY